MHELKTGDDKFNAYLDARDARITRLFRRAPIEMSVMIVMFFVALITAVLVVPSII